MNMEMMFRKKIKKLTKERDEALLEVVKLRDRLKKRDKRKKK